MMMMRSSGLMNRDGGPKIVQIETWYVETDAVNFRDVVQSLTGKNSSIADCPEISAAALPSSYKGTPIIAHHGGDGIGTNVVGGTKPQEDLSITNVSLKDFDLFFADLPTSIEDLIC